MISSIPLSLLHLYLLKVFPFIQFSYLMKTCHQLTLLSVPLSDDNHTPYLRENWRNHIKHPLILSTKLINLVAFIFAIYYLLSISTFVNILSFSWIIHSSHSVVHYHSIQTGLVLTILKHYPLIYSTTTWLVWHRTFLKIIILGILF